MGTPTTSTMPPRAGCVAALGRSARTAADRAATCSCPCRASPCRGCRACRGRLPDACAPWHPACRVGLATQACWVPEEWLPSRCSPEPAARDAGGWLPGELAASAPPRAGSALTLVPVSVSPATRPSSVPMRAPTSAPTATRDWPRRRSDRFTAASTIEPIALGCRRPMNPNARGWIASRPLTSSPRRRSAGLAVSVRSSSAGFTSTAPAPIPGRCATAATARAGRQPHRVDGASTL